LDSHDSESHLYYYRARYYDPALGRFLSADPIGFGGGDTNFYRYVENNPNRFRDPFGLQSYGNSGTCKQQELDKYWKSLSVGVPQNLCEKALKEGTKKCDLDSIEFDDITVDDLPVKNMSEEDDAISRLLDEVFEQLERDGI